MVMRRWMTGVKSSRQIGILLCALHMPRTAKHSPKHQTLQGLPLSLSHETQVLNVAPHMAWPASPPKGRVAIGGDAAAAHPAVAQTTLALFVLLSKQCPSILALPFLPIR